jgi:hypothetical protein
MSKKLSNLEVISLILLIVGFGLFMYYIARDFINTNNQTPETTEKYQATILEQIAYDAYIVTLKKDDKLHYYILFTETYDNLYIGQKIIVVIMDNNFVVPYVEYIDNIIDGFKWCDYFDRNSEQGGVGWCLIR